MSERDCAAVDVETIGIDRQLAKYGQHLRRECLVQLDEVDLIQCQSCALERLLHCWNRTNAEAFRLDAGSLIAYPATSLHRVGAVTRGTRLAAVGWARSFVRDPAQRELLFDLDTARRQLFAREGKSTEFDLISKSFANLLRMWADD